MKGSVCSKTPNFSGFVIASAYDRRIDSGMSWQDFCVRRIIRLYPMIVLGVLLGGIAVYVSSIVFHDMSVSDCLLFTLSALVLIPAGFFKHLQAYPVNNPIWSLFFELFANVAYVVERKWFKFGWRLMSVLIALSLALLTLSAIQRNGFDSLGFNSPKSFLMGFPRVMFPFFTGVALHRFGIYERFPKLNPLWSFLALAVVLGLPIHAFTAAYDVIAVAIAVPLIVCVAARGEESGNAVVISRFLGELSYPIYLIHQPIVRVAAIAYQVSGMPVAGKTWCLLAVALACIGLSFAVSRYLDQPVRAWLSRWSARFFAGAQRERRST